MQFNARQFLERLAGKKGGCVRVVMVSICAWLAFEPTAIAGTKDPYELLAVAGLDRDIKQGFTLRNDTWSGDLAAGGSKRIEYTLFRGNDYRFYSYAAAKGAKITFHIQDRDGAVIEDRCWQQEKDDLSFAGADILPKSTGSYYLVIKVEQSSAERTDWSLMYAYK